MKVDFKNRKVYFDYWGWAYQPIDWNKALREAERFKAIAIATSLPVVVATQRTTENENI